MSSAIGIETVPRLAVMRPPLNPKVDDLVYGADPEFFLFSGRPGARHFIKPHDVGIPPMGMKIASSVDGHYFRDGFAVEFNPMPAVSPHILHYRVRRMIKAVERSLSSDRQAEISLLPIPWVRVGRPAGSPPDVVGLGCSPSLNAYGESQLSRRINPMEFPFRSSGGHIHITTPAPGKGPGLSLLRDPSLYPYIVRILDKIVGAPLTYIFEEGYRRNFSRRTLYGRAGEYREQIHGDYMGLEYRVPGPHIWAINNTTILARVLENIEWVVRGEGFTQLVESVVEVGDCAGTRNYINLGLRPFPFTQTPALNRLQLNYLKQNSMEWLGAAAR